MDYHKCSLPHYKAVYKSLGTAYSKKKSHLNNFHKEVVKWIMHKCSLPHYKAVHKSLGTAYSKKKSHLNNFHKQVVK